MEATASSQRLDRVPRQLDTLLSAEQLQQYEHPLMRTQSTEQSDLVAQRPADDSHPHAQREPVRVSWNNVGRCGCASRLRGGGDDQGGRPTLGQTQRSTAWDKRGKISRGPSPPIKGAFEARKAGRAE
jgi:hypothetical protein